MCRHKHKTCKQLKWGTSENIVRSKGKVISKSYANIDLWYCLDCNRELIYDWHIGKYVSLQLSEKDGYSIYRVK